MIEAYPLYWPEGRKKTNPFHREPARFDTSFGRARDNVVNEVELLCGRYSKINLIVSTNIALRRDGLPLANQRQPEDTGVAVYFDYKGKQVCFACDRWKKIEHNMQAISKTIEALRGIARWGTGDMLEAAFKGFAALPAPGKRDWQVVLGLQELLQPTLEDVRTAYRRLASLNHPDKGGNSALMAEINQANDDAITELSR